MSSIHVVAKGDTLSGIAKKFGSTVKELKTINHITNPNRLKIGQEIQLKKESVLAVQLLVLDKDRNPIPDLHYFMEYAGKQVKGLTSVGGLSKPILTDTPNDLVRILIRRFDGSLKEIGSVVSGYGNKLVTLISPSIKVNAKTEKHPDMPKGHLPNKSEKPKPIHKPHAKKTPTVDKKDLGPKVTPTITTDGKPLAKVEGDIPDLRFLGAYVGGEVTKEDIEAAAKELECESGLIYAIARQESAHSSFIKIGNNVVPTILYERHWFRKLTKPNKSSPSPYEDIYPDICGSAYHQVKRGAKDKVTRLRSVIDTKTGKEANVDDIYGSAGLPQYKRLVKAYQLDKSAALQACSWGKFQIMGFNYKSSGYSNVFEFVKAMSSGDPAHIKAFLKFAKSNKTLLDGLQNKDYIKIAEGHNGASWKTINPHYASNLENFYKEYK